MSFSLPLPPVPERIRRVSILAPGLLGGSVGLALRKFQPNVEVVLWARREEVLHSEHARLASHRQEADIQAATKGADLVLLASPVGVMPKLASELHASQLAPEAIVSDVGSVKSMVVDSVRPILTSKGITFLGSHPMAGSEKSGIEAAFAELFLGARCLITPTDDDAKQTVETVAGFWQALGCVTENLTPTEHDHAVARISHLPYITAVCAIRAAIGDNPALARHSASGLRDTTRVASSLPSMWREILMENRLEVMAAIRDLQCNLSTALEFLQEMDDESLLKFLSSAKELRDAYLPKRT